MSERMKGPWHLKVCRTMAHVHSESGYVGISLPYKTDAEKTVARLIAAAPELLEMLEWYVEEDETIETMAGNEYWVEGKHRAMAIIAKAKGESA